MARDRVIEQEIGREKKSCSLWLRILDVVREKYLFKEDLVSSPRRWTTTEEGIQYLRELTMLEIIHCNPEYYHWLDPESIPCTQPMWKKVIKGAPASYVNCLITIYDPKTIELTVDTMCAWIRSIAENLEDASDFLHTHTRERMKRRYEYSRYEDNYRDRDYRDRPVEQCQPRSRPRSQT
ncbi:hypothetical protein BTVI_38047 [Pitangus sulphuratus]|nr:hypothetical protein BTVI_38047 [Pitangus sulphuratus]